jgi:Ca-activated chloride channel family protein
MRQAALLLLAPALLFADAGVIIPGDKPEPDPAILSLAEMDIEVLIDNQTARVRVRQIFQSRQAAVLEGKYQFALPGRALVSDFAVWDDVTRIPGVILERKRAQEIYEDLRWQAIDPGLLQMGERDADEARRGAVFAARIVPIPGYGTKRVEMEYHEQIPVEQLQSFFAIPLRPDVYRAQVAGRLGIKFEMVSRHALKDFQNSGAIYPLKIDERTANRVRASFEGRNVSLAEDFAVRWTLDAPRGPRLEVLTHKQPEDVGFVMASLLTQPVAASTQAKTVVALLDTSLSMQWEKLDRNFRALETLLRSLTPQDRFSVILFNDQPTALTNAPVAATPEAVDQALAGVRAARIRGGTNLQAALEAGLAQARGQNASLVVLSDGGSTAGTVSNGKLLNWYSSRWGQIAAAERPKTYVFAVGDDANLPLAKMLARNGGLFEWVRSTEPIEFKLQAFLAKVGQNPIEGLRAAFTPAANFAYVYPLQEAAFPGGVASWIGQYKAPGAATVQVGSQRAQVTLPATNAAHEHLPRTWAKARVDDLIEKIEREGEDAASIDEIIALSRKYKFVTPYTSFLAAPRALLRPRLIRPGDPVLRVKTDPAIVSVVAVFPFGLVKPLRYLDGEDTWQTRFLAPADMTDGTHPVRLLLRDKEGRVYKESKSFIIASKPPVVRVRLASRQVRRGEAVRLQVSASATTRTIVARMPGAAPVSLHWNPEAKTNTGQLIVPSHLPVGTYRLTVNAEDFAHNVGTQEVNLDVLP